EPAQLAFAPELVLLSGGRTIAPDRGSPQRREVPATFRWQRRGSRASARLLSIEVSQPWSVGFSKLRHSVFLPGSCWLHLRAQRWRRSKPESATRAGGCSAARGPGKRSRPEVRRRGLQRARAGARRSVPV